MPKLVNRKETKYEKRLESMIYAMTSFVRSAEFDDQMCGGSATDRAQRLKHRLEYDLINPCIYGDNKQWIPTTEKHETRNATSYLTHSGRAGFIKLSFNFQESH